MEHPHIRRAMPMIEPGKTSPRRLLWQQTHHGVETVRRTQYGEQMNPPKLGGTEIVAASLPPVARQQLIYELVWNEARKHCQKLGGASGRKGCLHTGELPEKTLYVATPINLTVFSA
jgi:hypothetical protein